MKRLLRCFSLLLSGVLLVVVCLIAALLFYPRPIDFTPARVFAPGGSEINYCQLPMLDGSGLLAKDFPQAHTPNCGYQKFPQPILLGCTEPLVPGATDLRGLWQQVKGGRAGHIERIKQCGNRVVVTAAGVIHDLTTDGSLAGASNDVKPLRLDNLALCIRTSATTEWHDGRLEFYAFGGPKVVERYLVGDQLHWQYPHIGLTQMRRICHLSKDS